MIIVISGPSGSGKSTLAGLFEVKGFKRIVTSTNRDRRLNDPEGQYYFVPKEEWNDDDYICVTNYGGNKYGIDKGYFDEINKDLNYIVVLDEAGLKELKEYYDNVYGFYLNVVEKHVVNVWLNVVMLLIISKKELLMIKNIIVSII